MCPRCGHELELGGQQSYCPGCGAYYLQLSDALELRSSIVTHQPSPNEQIRSSIDAGREASFNFDSQGHRASMNLQAPRRENEGGDLEVCSILVGRLNQDGADWHELTHLKPESRDERGVDCIARDGGRVLQIQVTRAYGDPGWWKKVNEIAPVSQTIPYGDLVDHLREAITRKKTKPKGGIVLALDSIETPHAGTDVVNRFRREHGTWAQSLGYDAIWVVGPNAELNIAS